MFHLFIGQLVSVSALFPWAWIDQIYCVEKLLVAERAADISTLYVHYSFLLQVWLGWVSFNELRCVVSMIFWTRARNKTLDQLISPLEMRLLRMKVTTAGASPLRKDVNKKLFMGIWTLLLIHINYSVCLGKGSGSSVQLFVYRGIDRQCLYIVSQTADANSPNPFWGIHCMFSVFVVKMQVSYSWFHIKGTWSVHSFNGDYLYIYP